MALICEWCNGKEAPFVKLREGNGFICNRCYKILEREQEEFDREWM